ncbi:MAG: hypothetical protein KME60_25530 [Cyanomargarita calcarea GSE-NOS-MK-12-04C]|jgi:hypothetical protein|uniref:Uncharacterized protein n=1 Tax=Cyanomargarita calcarea GSE-NOS-MK-12-04C TaxID=2839659 RepID=A0A951QTT4_9CYAN|nr:hypothetical protein [Cyanomargarita calcarea GSE-NOS-MK-12-04C]
MPGQNKIPDFFKDATGESGVTPLMLTKNQPFQQRSLSYRYPQNPIKFLGEGSDLPFASGILQEVGNLGVAESGYEFLNLPSP